MVFQSYALFPAPERRREHRVRPQGARACPRPSATRGSSASPSLLGLDELLERKPSQLSGGQQQRVALGRAIIAETPVCLMDEPLSNLDAQLRQEMRREIRALQQRLGMTMVYVTHDQTEAMSMADQVVLLRDGRIEQDARAGRALRAARDGLRGALHRHAADEHARRRGRRPRRQLQPRARRAGRPHARRRAAGSVALGAAGVRPPCASVEYLGADT